MESAEFRWWFGSHLANFRDFAVLVPKLGHFLGSAENLSVFYQASVLLLHNRSCVNFSVGRGSGEFDSFWRGGPSVEQSSLKMFLGHFRALLLDTRRSADFSAQHCRKQALLLVGLRSLSAIWVEIFRGQNRKNLRFLRFYRKPGFWPSVKKPGLDTSFGGFAACSSAARTRLRLSAWASKACGPPSAAHMVWSGAADGDGADGAWTARQLGPFGSKLLLFSSVHKYTIIISTKVGKILVQGQGPALGHMEAKFAKSEGFGQFWEERPKIGLRPILGLWEPGFGPSAQNLAEIWPRPKTFGFGPFTTKMAWKPSVFRPFWFENDLKTFGFQVILKVVGR